MDSMADATTLDRLIADVADELCPDAPVRVVSADPSGALSAWAHMRGPAVVAANDYREYTRALAAGHRALVGSALVDSELTDMANVLCVGHLPKSLAGIRHLARQLALAGVETLVLGANTKHMSRSMNDELARSYHEVRASRGRGKFRCLIASSPISGLSLLPPSTGGPGGRLRAVGGVFGGASDDAGGRLLARAFLSRRIPSGRMIDLGCGNGSVSRRILDAAGSEAVTLIATDVDADAVASASLTLADHIADGRAQVTWDDAGGQCQSGSADVVLLNPPFHDGAAIDTHLVEHLLDSARRLLAPGGELYLVYNSHLRYRPLVERRFANVTQCDRDRRFTVLCAY